MTRYPLVIRNRVPFFYRGFMLLWMGGVAMMTAVALRDGPPQSGLWWPWIMLVFWLAGFAGLLWSFNQEASVVRIPGPRSIHVRRGKALRRVDHWTDRARFWIKETQDSDGDPYVLLLMDAPDGALTVAEGHFRDRLEETQARIEAAVKG